MPEGTTSGVICPHCKSFKYYYCMHCDGNKVCVRRTCLTTAPTKHTSPQVAYCAAHNTQAKNKHPLHVKVYEGTSQKCVKCNNNYCIKDATVEQVQQFEKKQVTTYQGRLDEGTR